jgi:O-antigen chain-terminating methyltransferase
VPARGVDASAEMVARCRERGLEAEAGDLFAALAAAAPGSLGAVVSFHVVEHLAPPAIARLVHLAWRALAPGGVLILETPNPLSLVVAARSFWLDPTHVRPVHPETLRLVYELAGFDPVEHLELRPFPEGERLPEIDLAALPADQRALADRVNRLRDGLDDLLFGHQDYALIGTRAAEAAATRQ